MLGVNYFVKKVLIFFLPVFISAIVMEYLLRSIPNDYSYKSEYLNVNASKIEILILGSSHTYFGLNPEYFTFNTFNASHISQTLDLDYEIINKYKDEFVNLKVVVLPISYFSFFSKLDSGPESWRIKNYVLYYGFDFRKSIFDYFEIFSNRFDLNVKRLVSYYVNGKSEISCSRFGWGTKYNSRRAKKLVKTGMKAAKRHSKNLNLIQTQYIFEENVKTLEAILELCEKLSVKVLLLTPPAFDTYRQNLNEVQLKKTIETAVFICSKYDNCVYVNLFDSESFIWSDYYDADHLSEIGARKLSKMVDRKVSELLDSGKK